MTIKAIRAEVPGISQQIQGNDLVYFDWAATGFTPQCVIDAVTTTMEDGYGAIRRGVHSVGARATRRYEDSRRTVAEFIGGSSSELILTAGTTHGLNLLVACAAAQLEEGDVVVLTVMEHHSHLLPWREMAERKKLRIEFVELDAEGRISLRHLHLLLERGGVKIIGFPLVSNVLGTVQPVSEIVDLAQRYGVRVLVDGAQAVGHHPIDVKQLGIDAFVFGGHKLYGPTGVGALWVCEDWLESWSPYMLGGGMVHDSLSEPPEFASPPFCFEAGTPNLSGAVGLAAATSWIRSIGWDMIVERERLLRDHLQEQLLSFSALSLLCNAPDIPIFSFVTDLIHPHDLSTILDLDGIAVRAGHHCTQSLHAYCQVNASTRISLSFLNTMEECDFFCERLQRAIRYFQEN